MYLRALVTLLLLTNPLAAAASDIPSDTPISSLIKSANVALAGGNAAEALRYFNLAVARDPSDYLTVFKRGAAYLALGKSPQASADFDRALVLKPNFEGALIQRAKLRARAADWDGAAADYRSAGHGDTSEVLQDILDARSAAETAVGAEAAKAWEECVAAAGQAIMVAGGAAELRRLRARCRFERGELEEAVGDLQHVLHLSTGDTAPHLQVSATEFYALGETEKGLAQVRKCLQSDPDSKTCRALLKREKDVGKRMTRLAQIMEKRQYNSAAQMMIPLGDQPGLMKEVKEDSQRFRDEGYIHASAPDGLYTQLVEMTCQAYFEMNNLKRAQTYCTEAQTLNPDNTYGLLVKAQQQIDADEFEAAIHTLNEAKDRHPDKRRVQEMQQNAQTLLKRSRSKDYYKVLGVDRDADERDIKRAYRTLTRQFHPDKAAAQGIAKEDAEKKMASINEAYEVLGDPELKARFDRGDDPNDQEGQMRNPFQQGAPFGFGGGHQQFVFRSGPGGGGGFGGGGFQFPGGFGFP